MSSVALLINEGAAGDKGYKSTNSRITPKQMTPDIHHEDNSAERKESRVVSRCSWFWTLFQWVLVALTILHFAFDITPITIESKDWWFIFGSVMINIQCAKWSKMYRYLSNIDGDQHVRQFVNELREIPIMIWWSVRCYHIESKSTGTDISKTRRVKVTTHSARRQFEYAVCTDITGNLGMLDEHNVTMLRLEKAYEFADRATEQQYNLELTHFKEENDKDRVQEYHEEISIEGFQDTILAFSNDRARSKFQWMRPWIFLLFSACGLSPCFKCVVRQFCGEMTLVITKRIKR